MPKHLAIIGASYLQLPLVKRAKERGIITHCFAWEEGAVCKDVADYFYPISVLDKESILAACVEIGIDGITTIATDISVPTISYVANKLRLIGNSEDSALITTNKFLMREALKKAGCLVPLYQQIESTDAIPQLTNFPWIVKPVDRSGSKGVSKVNTQEDLISAVHVARAESLSGSVIIEQYIDGHEVSVETISWNGKHYPLAITDKITSGPPHFVELAHHQPSLLSKELLDKIYSTTFDALEALSVKYGAGHTEIKINDKGEPYLIELGARMGGDFIGSHLVKLSTGYDFVNGVISVALNGFQEPFKTMDKFSGVFFLSEQTKSILPFFHNQNDFDHEKEIMDQELKVVSNSNERSGYLIYQSDRRIFI